MSHRHPSKQRPVKKPDLPEVIEARRVESERIRLGRRLDEIRALFGGDLRGPAAYPDHPDHDVLLAEWNDLQQRLRRLPQRPRKENL